MMQCPKCGCEEHMLPHEEAPDNDAICNRCHYCFGPHCPEPHNVDEYRDDFIALRPKSAPYFENVRR